MEKKNLGMVKIISIVLIVHTAYLFLAQKQLTISNKAYVLASNLPILLSSVILFMFALNILIKSKLSLKMLVLGSSLSWVGCFGWFICKKIFEQINDWQVFYSPVFLFPIFLIYFFTRPKVKEQFSR